MFYVLLVLSDRRKAKESSSGGRATEATTKKTKKNDKKLDVYELATEVTGDVDSLDKSGRLASTKNANPSRDDTNDLLHTYAEASMFDGYSSLSPVQDSNSESPGYYNQVGRGETRSGPDGSWIGGNVGQRNGGVMDENRALYDSIKDNNVGDNTVYANLTLPAATPPLASSSSSSSSWSADGAAAAEAEQTRGQICTSINDFTLIDNTVYNQ